MGILILPVLAYIFYLVIFKDSKSDVSKLKGALKDTDTAELNFVKELIENELNSRVKHKETIDINLNDL